MPDGGFVEDKPVVGRGGDKIIFVVEVLFLEIGKDEVRLAFFEVLRVHGVLFWFSC